MLKAIFSPRSCNIPLFRRFYSGDQFSQPLKITICGAASQTGQIISFFLKQSHFNLDISLYDTTPGLTDLAKQLSLINTRNKVDVNIGPIKLRNALRVMNIVAIVTKTKTSSRLSHAENFEQNFTPLGNIVKCCIEVCPEAVLGISTNPLNCIIPATNEIYKYYGLSNSDKIIGIPTTDVMAAAISYATMYKLDPTDVFVPITGGTSYETALPVFSEGSPSPQEEIGRDHSERLYNHFLELKNISMNADLSAGYGISKFLESLIRAMLGEKDIVETAFVRALEDSPAKYMTSIIDLGENGITTVYGSPINLNRFEKKCLQTAITLLQRDITMSEKYVFTSTKAEARAR